MIQKPKGTYDIYGNKGKQFLYLKNLFSYICTNYNYNYIKTPMFENSELFHRGIGEDTDIVSKETYDFKDRGDRDLTLRPEGTASVVRSIIENKLYIDTPVKLFYMGSMFRYERPQAGRYRELYQLGLEVYGSNSPLMDVEVISVAYNFFSAIGITDICVNINTLGDSCDRLKYREALIEYFNNYKDLLCEDCLSRLEKNPLRILDCKADMNQDFMKNCPKISDYLSDESKAFFDQVKKNLNSIGIEYVVNENLVRGLDYYTHTIFEIVVKSNNLGNQSVVCGGGRYNNLVKTLDGPNTPAVGFGIGLDRLLHIIDEYELSLDIKENVDILVTYISNNELEYAFKIATDLRNNGFSTEISLMDKNYKGQLKLIEKLDIKYLITVGENEKNEFTAVVKDTFTKEEETVLYDDIINYLSVRVYE